MSISPYRITLEGELSIFTAGETHGRLLAALAEGSEIEVDISLISEIDAAGLQLMVATKHQAAAINKPLRFLEPSRAVLQMLELCGLLSFLEDHADIPKAERA